MITDGLAAKAADRTITETLLQNARGLRRSPDPDEAIAAASWEKRFEEYLSGLKAIAVSKGRKKSR